VTCKKKTKQKVASFCFILSVSPLLAVTAILARERRGKPAPGPVGERKNTDRKVEDAGSVQKHLLFVEGASHCPQQGAKDQP